MEHYFFRTFSVNDNSPAGCNDQNDSFLREKHMYRDHPDEIISAIRTSNGIRGSVAYPDTERTRSDKHKRPKTGIHGQKIS